ncbi:hypothetical protein U9M48_032790, partial [Paspalum notatum var. saurae]
MATWGAQQNCIRSGYQFTSRFWKSLHEALGTNLDFSSIYHPQIDGQTKRVNQVMEDMLRACVLTYGRDWESSLPYAEFSYNNGYQASLGMAPFEALYGKKCRTPLIWAEDREKVPTGPALLKEASYADRRRRELSFEVGDLVYLKVSPIRGTRRFQVKGKLAPCYIGPYKIKAESEKWPTSCNYQNHCQISTTYRKVPIKILDAGVKKTRRSAIKNCRVLWSHHGEEESTWEREDTLRKEHPHLFEDQPNLEGEISSKWG